MTHVSHQHPAPAHTIAYRKQEYISRQKDTAERSEMMLQIIRAYRHDGT
jgi:hypothetical protein